MFWLCGSREAQVIDSQDSSQKKIVEEENEDDLTTPKESGSPKSPLTLGGCPQETSKMKSFRIESLIPVDDNPESTYDVEDTENRCQNLPIEDTCVGIMTESPEFTAEGGLNESYYYEIEENMDQDYTNYEDTVADVWVNEECYANPDITGEIQESWEEIEQRSSSPQDQPSVASSKRKGDKWISENGTPAFDDTFFTAPSLHVYEPPILSNSLLEEEPKLLYEYDPIEDEIDDHWAWVPPQSHQGIVSRMTTYSHSRPHTADINPRPLHLTDTIEDADEPYEISLYSAMVIPKTSTQSQSTDQLATVGTKHLKRPQSLPTGLIARTERSKRSILLFGTANNSYNLSHTEILFGQQNNDQ